MTINYKITTAILTLVVADHIRNNIKLQKVIETTKQSLEDADELTGIYAKKLNDTGIIPDEFEVIIMDNLCK